MVICLRKQSYEYICILYNVMPIFIYFHQKSHISLALENIFMNIVYNICHILPIDPLNLAHWTF